MPATLGDTPKTQILVAQEHALTYEFTAGNAIYAGQPVKINSSGAVIDVAASDDPNLVVGYALFDADSGDLVTVQVRGQMIVNGVATAAIVAGVPVLWAGYDTDEEYNSYTTSTFDSTPETYPGMVGWCLDGAAAADDPILVLLTK